MAFFEGGRIPTVGLSPQYIGNTNIGNARRSRNEQINFQSVNQVFQGSGKSFLAGPQQEVATISSNNIVNVGLNSLLSTDILASSGVDLTSGQNFLASSITPNLTSFQALSVNLDLGNALETAGEFGPIFSNFGELLGGITSGGGDLFSDTSPSQRFPGASDDAPADYGGGSSHTLGNGGPDVIFSLQPANQGPQMFGQQSLYDPSLGTTLGEGQFTNIPNSAVPDYSSTQNSKLTDIFGSSSSISNYDFSSTYDPAFENPSFAADNDTMTAFEQQEQEGWTFICAPDDISWSMSASVNRVDIFGTNNPPVVSGTKGMRDLSIGGALVEGFTRRVSVENKVQALEKLMNYTLNGSDGFVSVPVYQFWANNKVYGSTSDQDGYFIIQEVRVSEKMRDLSGNMTRATVDISLIQVPKYQVNTGRDLASEVTSGGKTSFANQGTVQQQAQQTTTLSGSAAGNANSAARAATGTSP